MANIKAIAVIGGSLLLASGAISSVYKLKKRYIKACFETNKLRAENRAAENKIKEDEEKHQNELKEMREAHEARMDKIRKQYEASMKGDTIEKEMNDLIDDVKQKVHKA